MRRISVFLSVLLILAAISSWKKERESLRGHLWREEQICCIVSAIANIKFRNLGLIFYRSRKKETLFFPASNRIRFLFFILACKGDCDFFFFKIDCGVTKEGWCWSKLSLQFSPDPKSSQRSLLLGLILLSPDYFTSWEIGRPILFRVL